MSAVVDNPMDGDGAELDVLRAGVRLMALRALADPDLADEVAQETITRAFHSLRVSRPENLGAFVAGIARHVIADIIRLRPRAVSLDTLPSDAEPQTSSDALTMLCESAERERVHQALALLSPEDRSLLHQSFFEELSPTEIAKRLGAPPERIRQRKLRALARLRLAFDNARSVGVPSHANAPGPTIKRATSGALETSRSTE